METGQPMLVNMQMSRICTQITGSGLMDAACFIKTLHSGDYPTCARLLRTEPTAAVELPDKTVWEFRRSTHIVQSCTIEQLLALNVTEPYRLSLELTDHNRRLAGVGARLRSYSRELQTVIRDDEILSAKIHVHNDVGRVLLMLRTFLAQKPGERDLSRLLSRWSFVISVLSGDERSQHADILVAYLGSFPDLAFLTFAVAYDNKHTVILTVELCGKCHTCAAGKSLSKRAGGDIYTRSLFHIRMSLKY